MLFEIVSKISINLNRINIQQFSNENLIIEVFILYSFTV